VQAVKALIKQFEQMRKVMRQVASGRMPDLGALMGGGAAPGPQTRIQR
jgi:signal recognition particle GTPase